MFLQEAINRELTMLFSEDLSSGVSWTMKKKEKRKNRGLQSTSHTEMPPEGSGERHQHFAYFSLTYWKVSK